ncbi:hypothetical protein U1Q18_004468, partial [Sarracenia purpurea var. burkii]
MEGAMFLVGVLNVGFKSDTVHLGLDVFDCKVLQHDSTGGGEGDEDVSGKMLPVGVMISSQWGRFYRTDFPTQSNRYSASHRVRATEHKVHAAQ